MFTGIVTDLGTVAGIATPVPDAPDRRFRITTSYDTGEVAIGASIACNGCCLTVVTAGSQWLAFDASGETLACSTLGHWEVGTRVNLERALQAGDELGGHIVSGHVDGIARITAVRRDGRSIRYEFNASQALAGFIAPKGSIALDGVSLTVNEVVDESDDSVTFGININRHTQSITTFSSLQVGACLNVEIDLLARYVARLTRQAAP